MFKNIVSLVFILLLQACGTIEFHPPVYGLSATKVPDFNVQGNIEISNLQDSVEPVILHSYGGTSLQSNYSEVTKTMITQALFELDRHGSKVSETPNKVIGLKVTHLNSRYVAFYWKGTMTYSVALGDSEPFDITVNHGTGAGAQQDLSGSIADGVLALYKDSRVKSYLSE